MQADSTEAPAGTIAPAPPADFSLWALRGPQGHAALLALDDVRAVRTAELHLAWRNAVFPRFEVEGECLACAAPSRFVVAWDYAFERHHGLTLPNWREWLQCPGCGLNNRQRASAWLAARLAGDGRIYATEQVTAFHRWLKERFGAARVAGSEYLGDGTPSGTVVNGVRHEDLERLSFADASFALVLSNDVLEHVFAPRRALAEMARVLAPGGHLVLTTPVDLQRPTSRVRARRGPAGVEMLEPPAYHGDPMSPDGCLVVTDFGWDLVEHVAAAGFADVEVLAFHAPRYGHLGGPQTLILARR